MMMLIAVPVRRDLFRGFLTNRQDKNCCVTISRHPTGNCATILRKRPR